MLIPKLSALFETSLASSLSAAGTTFSLVSATDRDGNALSGLYGFIIDEGSADEEFFIGTVSGTTVTVSYRGIDADAPNTEVSANKKVHRRGASVKITDYPIMGVIRNIVNGDDTLPNKLQYASHPTISGNQDIPDKQYVDALAIAGAPNATTTVQGLVEEATQAEIDAGTAIGGTGAKLFPPLDKLALSIYGTRLPTANEKTAITNLAQAILPYAADAQGSDTYVVTLSPAPSAYTAGMVVTFKANTANTGAATLNVNSLGAKTIVKSLNLTLHDGDIKAGQILAVEYDGTNFQLLSPVTSAYKSGTTTRAMNAASGAVTIAHGLGAIPRRIKVVAVCGSSSTSSADNGRSEGVYDGTTTSSYWIWTNVGSAVYNGVSASNILDIGPLVGTEQTAVATFDATNITLTWTKSGSPTGTAQLLWEAWG